MAELLALASAAAGVVTLVKKLTGSSENKKKEPLYTLTPPLFDRVARDDVLTLTPMEVWSEPRRRLFSRHFTGEQGENLLDARIHMAPPPLPGPAGGTAVRSTHDFMARIYLPQPKLHVGSGAGGAIRPLADARFHLSHPEEAHTFTDVVLRTEGGGTAYATGAINLTSAWQRAQQQGAAAGGTTTTTAAVEESRAAKEQARQRSAAQGPRGISTFFNLPLFGRARALEAEGASAPGEAVALGASPAAFHSRAILRDSPTWGVRFDDASFSAGVHLDPQWTLRALREQGAAHTARGLQLGGWLSQESDNVRFSAEGVVAPLRSRAAAAGAVGSAHAEGAPPVAAASMVPVSLSSRLPLLLQSRVGLFYRDVRIPSTSSSGLTARNSTRPNYEVGFTLSNAVPNPANPARVSQELVASYTHHLTVRRNIHNPLEHKQNRSIHNYVDLSMEVAYRNEIDHAAPAAPGQARAAVGAVALSPPSIRLGASWQVNKNSLLKLRMQDDSVSALYALKSWWDPSASAAFSVNHSFAQRSTRFGLSVDLENVGEVLFSRPDPSYKRMVASQRERVENLIEADENY